jgi:hypothetical protein
MYWDDVAGAMFYRYDNGGTPVWVSASAGGGGSASSDWTRTGTVLAPTTSGDTVQFSAGTAALPGISFVGDPNTGIYLFAADTLSLVTNGGGRVWVRPTVGTVAGWANQAPIINSFGLAGSNIDSGINGDVLANQNAGVVGYNYGNTNNMGGSAAVLAYCLVGSSTTPGPLFKGYTGAGDNDGTIRFKVDFNGNVTNSNNVYGSLSDAELKQDITDSESQWDDLKDVRIRRYRLKSDIAEQGEEKAPVLLGVVAQELEQVSPGLVETPPEYDDLMEDGTRRAHKTVKYSVLYMKALKALQEAMERIETLEARIDAAGI